ncbi:zinc-binding protein A33-like isoform X2 [Brienomyrus brachyistius]|nr:zinc-binding protein A33-like isoform X2 [Brienomyrus brachyistius]
MTSATIQMSEEHLRCSICLEVFSCPVSIPCGHSFCKHCICEQWSSKDKQQCPLCKTIFDEPVNLTVNVALAEITKEMGRKTLKRSFESSGVVCDVCVGEQLDAVKTCLQCLSSYCDSHVQEHLIRYEEHELVSPLGNPKDGICEVHSKLLEMFCREDDMCVCVLCAEVDHKMHHLVPVESEWTEKTTCLRNTELEVKQKILDRLKKVEELRKLVMLGEKNAEKEIEEGVQVFTTLKQTIDVCQASLINEIEQKQRAVQQRAKELIQALENEITALKVKSAELKRFSNNKDHINFLKTFSAVCAHPYTQDWSGVSSHTVMCVETPRLFLSVLKEHIKQLETRIIQAECDNAKKHAVVVNLDPRTAHPNLEVYENCTRVKYTGDGLKDKSLKRFSYFRAVLGKDGITSGRHYWEIQVKNASCGLGVADESAKRKQSVKLSPENGFWVVTNRNENFKAMRKTFVPSQ